MSAGPDGMGGHCRENDPVSPVRGWRGSCPVAVVVLDGQEGEKDGAGGAGDGDDGAVDDADDGVDQATDDDDSHDEVLPTIEWNISMEPVPSTPLVRC